jgi:hypothetical protein
MAVVHPIAAANLDARLRPDPNRASDPAAPDAFAKPLGEQQSA